MTTAVNPFASYKPAERRVAADEQLRAAIAEVDELIRQWEGRDAGADPEELRVLRERLQGARGQVKMWTRYIKSGCARSR